MHWCCTDVQQLKPVVQDPLSTWGSRWCACIRSQHQVSVCVCAKLESMSNLIECLMPIFAKQDVSSYFLTAHLLQVHSKYMVQQDLQDSREGDHYLAKPLF